MEQMPKKISQIKLSDFTYDIDVANNLKATKLIGEQLTKVAPVKAILKPDGQYDFFDENNKISSHYISDTILGQLKFGGTIAYDGADIFSISPSTLFYERALEFEATKESPSGESFSNPILVPSYGELGITLAILGDWGNGSSPLFNNDLVNLEGFYFILTTPSDPYTGNSPEEILIPKSNIGDWWVICGGKIEKIDNTDTITHIDETDGTSLLEITGSSGLKLNKLTETKDGIAFSGKLSSESLDGNSVELSPNNIALDYQSPAGRESKMTLEAGSLTAFSNYAYPQGDKSTFSSYAISTELNGIRAILRPNSNSIPMVSVENSSWKSYASLEFDGTSGVLKLNDTSDNTTTITANSLQSPEISATQKMTAPTISDTTDKTQVVNLDYFENNATKVDWENIDSEVHVINNHNVEIDGGLTVNDYFIVSPSSAQAPVALELIHHGPTLQENGERATLEPNADGSGWRLDTLWNGPYYSYSPVKAGYFYELNTFGMTTHLEEDSIWYVPEISSTAPISKVEPLIFTSEDTPSRHDTLRFYSDRNGFVLIGANEGTVADAVNVEDSSYTFVEWPDPKKVVKVDGDLEVTGDLSFGADSHLVFGTIEGTDFIADHAKVKNAPTEDDDVVNKAYFDANKGGGSATLAAAGSETLPVYIDASGSASAISSLELNRYAVEGDASSNSIHRTILNCESLTMTDNETAPGCQSVNISDNGSISLGIPAVGRENTLNISGSSIQFDTPEEYGLYPSITLNGKKVLVEGDVESLPAEATEGAFLRYRNGAAVWEVVPSAEGNTF